MKINPSTMKWALRFYPPFFFQRIWVKDIYEDFQGADIKIAKSLFNMNANKTIFGGTIFSAMDPIHSILIDQHLKSKGFKKTVAWLKSAKIDYLKPGRTDLEISVRLADQELDDAIATIKDVGKIVKTFTLEVFDKNGVLCAVSHNEIYIRDLSFKGEVHV